MSTELVENISLNNNSEEGKFEEKLQRAISKTSNDQRYTHGELSLDFFTKEPLSGKQLKKVKEAAASLGKYNLWTSDIILDVKSNADVEEAFQGPRITGKKLTINVTSDFEGEALFKIRNCSFRWITINDMFAYQIDRDIEATEYENGSLKSCCEVGFIARREGEKCEEAQKTEVKVQRYTYDYSYRWFLNNQLHRTSGPAVIENRGRRLFVEWRQRNVFHRDEDLPAYFDQERGVIKYCKNGGVYKEETVDGDKIPLQSVRIFSYDLDQYEPEQVEKAKRLLKQILYPTNYKGAKCYCEQ